MYTKDLEAYKQEYNYKTHCLRDVTIDEVLEHVPKS